MSINLDHGLTYILYILNTGHLSVVNSEGQVKIADFGVGCKLQETLGVADSFVGTVTYMDVSICIISMNSRLYQLFSSQPARISGQPHTSNSDVWSLGLTIMECALG